MIPQQLQADWPPLECQTRTKYLLAGGLTATLGIGIGTFLATTPLVAALASAGNAGQFVGRSLHVFPRAVGLTALVQGVLSLLHAATSHGTELIILVELGLLVEHMRVLKEVGDVLQIDEGLVEVDYTSNDDAG